MADQWEQRRTDTFAVFWEYEHTEWKSTGISPHPFTAAVTLLTVALRPIGMVIDCAESDTCSQQNVNLNQTCTENKITSEGSIKGTIETKLPEWFEGWLPSFNFVSVKSTNNLVNEKICTETSSSGSCSWNDQQCHGIWTAQRNRRVWYVISIVHSMTSSFSANSVACRGYQRRTCTSSRSGTNMPNTSARPDGYYTVGMQDISIVVPDSTMVGCAALCGEHSYPYPVPDDPDPGTAKPVND